MKNPILLFIYLVLGISLNAQVLESNKVSPLFINVKPIIFNDATGNPLIEIEGVFRRNKQLKRQVKSMKIKNKTYQIVLERNRQAIYEKDGPLVATINWAGNKIHLEEENITYKRKVKPFKNLEYYEDEQGEKIITTKQIKGRKYRLSLHKETTDYPILLMALSFHQFVEEQKCVFGTNETFFPCLSF